MPVRDRVCTQTCFYPISRSCRLPFRAAVVESEQPGKEAAHLLKQSGHAEALLFIGVVINKLHFVGGIY